MRRLLLTVLGGLALAGAARAAEAGPDAHYQALVSAAKTADPATVDWQALRFAYADSSAFDLMGQQTDAPRRAMFDALNKDDNKAVVQEANAILDKDYVDIDAHVALDLAYQATGQKDASAREHQIALGLLKSVHTGDGTAPDKAFTVISVGEEYAVMRAFAMRVTGQALVEMSPHSYDRLTAVDADGKTHTFFFLVDRVMADEAKLLKTGK
ncbi:MAG TPA: DUF4919 domain-containing protein [Caulobacteraceae bacterium]|nr:DUF4919 domain-containing protein [Caulobacteraceae bacterium]